MTSASYTLTATIVNAVAALTVASSALAQAQFRDEKTGKIWTPENVSKESQLRPSNEPVTPADRAFDPNAQIATATGVVIQRPVANLVGVVPITAGPTVPLLTIETPQLQAVPGDRWVAPIYLTNNSGGDINAQLGCTFANGSRPVQESRIVVPTAGPGQRLAFVAYGPRTDIFVDRVGCRVLTP
jgi:hypothetical protein